jgi:hypothetical protein
MRQLNVGTPTQVQSYIKQYTQFRGVDFSTDSTQVDPSRSPAAQNIISDMKGFPEKRLGWRYLHKLSGTIHNLFFAVFANGDNHFFAHVGTSLYVWDETDSEPSLAVTGIADNKSKTFVHAGKVYILDGEMYRVLTKDADGFHLASVADADPYIPTVQISITGNAVTVINEKTGESIGGHTFVENESPNYLTAKRKCTMVGDGTSTIFHLPEEKVSQVVSVKVNDEDMTDFTLDAEKGHITFKTAPAIATDGAGLANIEVIYECTPEDADKSADRINHCTLCDQFGYFNDNRFFLSGEDNREYQNVDYMSGNDDPTYFPYDGFVRIGSDTAKIMGYLKQYDSQLIIKEDNEQDAQIFARTAMMDNESGTLFPVQQGIKGVGAVSKGAMGMLRDDPLFLAEEGVFSIVSGAVKEQRALQERSTLVNARLRKEENLASAVSASWNGYYVLCVNDHCYVADSRQMTGMSNTEQMGYEWYYWTNVPATMFLVHNGYLYFASKDNGICKFNSDRLGVNRYSDASYPMIKLSEMTDDQREYYISLPDNKKQPYRESIERGVAIEAVWATKADTFDTITNVKNILKKGCAVMVKPYTRSSIELGYLTDREGRASIKTETADIFDFSDIDFSRMTFNTLDVPQVIPVGKKIKKFNILQFFLVSREINEGFGIYGIQLTYTIGGYVK